MNLPSRFKVPKAFWTGVGNLGLTPGAVLHQAQLPVVFYDSEKNFVTTAQYFALWRALGELSSDPAAGLTLASKLDFANLPPSMIAAYCARDYRDAISRTARFKQLCSPEEMHVTESSDECVIELAWVYAAEETPTLLTDAAFASFVELGRRGTLHPVQPTRVELKRSAESTGVHKAYFNCPVKFRARRDALVLHSVDLDRPFATYNAELLEMLNPQLEKTLNQSQSESSIGEQVKWILKRLLAGARPDIPMVARELGLGERTLQRRIVEEGASFRQLLAEARQELVREYLARPDMQINERALNEPHLVADYLIR